MVAALLGREDELRAVDDLVAGRLTAVAFAGGPGTGKSALLDELAARAQVANLSVHRVHASPEAADIPFGAMAHLLPEDVGDDRLTALRAAAATLAGASGRHGAIVIVDDAHDLDPASVAVVQSIVTGRRTRVAVAVDADRPIRAGLARMWRDGHMRRTDLLPLSRDHARELLEAVAGGPVADDVERRVWELTAGRPGLVRAVGAAAAYEQVGGLLRLADDLADERLRRPALLAIAEPALAQLTSEGRRALAVLALTNRADIDLVAAVTSPDAADELESSGLTLSDGSTLTATVPLFAAAALGALTTRGRSRLVGALADQLWERNPIGGDELVQAVRWRLQSGGECDGDTIARAATTALTDGDYESAAELARAAARRAPTADDWKVHVTLAGALRQLGDHAGAESAFAVAAELAPDPAARVDVTIARARNLGIGDGHLLDALGHLAAVRDGLTDPVLVRRVAIEQTFLSAVIGDLRLVADAAGVILEDPDVDDATAVVAATGRVFASTMLLRLDEVERAVRHHRAQAEQLAPLMPLAVDQLDLMAAVVEVARGRVDAAVATCGDRLGSGRDAGWGCGDGAWRAVEVFARTFTCDPDLRRRAHRAVVALRSLDPLGLRFVGRGLAAVALVHAGAIAEARSVWRASRPRTEGDRRVGSLIEARLGAWELAIAGEPTVAARRLAEAFAEGREFGHLLWGALALHDAVRLDVAEVVIDALRELRSTEGATGALLDVIVEHAAATSARDPAELIAVADTFRRMGADRFAAEALVRAGQLLAELGRAEESHVAVARAQRLAHGRLPGAPWAPPIAASLTDRQLEIVEQALRGSTSREIAHGLTLSVRTVDNHLAAVYRNLGLSGRADLAAAVDPPRE